MLLSRYLTPIRPPMEVVDLERNKPDYWHSIEKAAHFVSLIPFENDLKTFEDLDDLYCTCQEFLDLKQGDYEEHAILLANFFLYIDKEQGNDATSYLIYGDAVPEGRTVFVMRQKNN